MSVSRNKSEVKYINRVHSHTLLAFLKRYVLRLVLNAARVAHNRMFFLRLGLGLMAISTQWLLDVTPYLMQKVLSNSNSMYM